MRFTKTAALVAAGVAVAVAATACGPAFIRVEEPSTRETQTVPIDGAQAVDARLNTGVCELRVQGGAATAMDATFEYRPRRWQPHLDHSIEGTTVVLRVDAPRQTGFDGGGLNVWDVRFNDALPLRLSVETGVGKSTLDLAGLTLDRVDVQGGVGDSTIDLGSTAKRDVTVRVDGGVGKIRLIVPAEAGVRVWGYQDGVGKFDARGFTRGSDNELVNENYGKPGVKTIDVSVQRGVGDVTIEQR